MQTTETAYIVFLERKYRPGRDLYLMHLIYPRFAAEFSSGLIYDIGCGFGKFLEFCKRRNLSVKGFDSNPQLVARCVTNGFEAVLEDMVHPAADYPPARNLLCDNVLEHFTLSEIDSFFSSVKRYWQPDGVLLVVVPNRRGYESDPTHRTFVDEKLISQMALKNQLTLARQYRYPVPWRMPGDLYVFNMTVFRLENRMAGSKKNQTASRMKMTLSNIKKHNVVWMTVVLFLLGIVFRLWLLGAAPFKADTMEFFKLALRNQDIVEFWKNPPWMNQIPLNETFSLLLIKAGLPATPFVVRLPFAIMGAIALFFVWNFARRWFGRGAALLVLLLAAFNPYQIYFSRSAYHYSGAVCWSAALFLAFWSIRETIHKNEAPEKKQMTLWFLAAAAACHMHMSVWVVVGLQGVLLFISGWKLMGDQSVRFFLQLLFGGLLLGGVMSRWIVRAVSMSLNGMQQLGGNASSEFLRLLPAYFAGENAVAVALLLVFIVLAVVALFRASEYVQRYRTLAWVCVLHISVLMLYVGLVGGGVAKITYFSAVWPHFILLMGVGTFLGIHALAKGAWRPVLYVLLACSYIAVTAVPNLAIVQLEGKPTPFYKINDWVQSHLPPGTPVLTDRWFEPWNELAVHNPGGLNYAFTVPDEPIDNYKRFNWPETVWQFFEKYPDAAFLELSRDRFAEELGPWTFPEEYFVRTVSITNEPAMVLRQWKVFPEMDYAAANTNRVVVRIFYNTAEDLLAAARRDGKETLRLWSEGWGYAKPGWPQGDFRDFRILGRAAVCDLYNLTDLPLHGVLEISAAAVGSPKAVTVNGTTTVFSSPGLIRAWKVPLTLQSGKNEISFTSPSDAPLFVLDIRWNPDPL